MNPSLRAAATRRVAKGVYCAILTSALAGCSDDGSAVDYTSNTGSTSGTSGEVASGAGPTGSNTTSSAATSGAGTASTTTGGTSATGASTGTTGGGTTGSGGAPGSTATGTQGSGGAAQASTATTTGSAGSGGGGSTPTAGCGAATQPASGRFSIDVGGTTREYIVAIPDGYDSNQPYRLIFAWHPRGGSAEQVAGGFGGGYYGLESLANGSAIFVSPEGIDQGWANTGGRDIEFLRAMLDRFRSEMCIDESRIFSTGFSYGGMMSFAVGCAMGDVFRAIAPMSGALYSGCENGDSPVAVFGIHGDNDTVVPLGDGEAGRDEFLERNNCQTQTMPVEPSPCVSYQGCDAGYPVVWCEFSGGHSIWNESADAVWDFFSQF